MSSDPKPAPNTNPQTQSENLDGVRALEEALAGINSALTRSGEELSEQDLAKVLKQLETAEGVADDVEGKLDDLLRNLGGMLEGLEADKGGEQGAAGGKQT